MSETSSGNCSDAQIGEILQVSAADTVAGLAAIDVALNDFPEDARLHFLKGSMLIGEKRFIAAHSALSRAVAIAPDFYLARFQLGFFELTSGEAETAKSTFQPLHALPDGSYLKLFVEGLEHLIGDRFDQCIASLRAGIELNQENEPLNNDMRLIIDRCTEMLGGRSSAMGGETDEAVSATSLLLGAKRRPN